MSYEQWQSRIPQAPPWFLRPRGAAWLRAHGKIKDLFVALVKQAAKAGLPSHAPEDALVEIGAERQLDQGPTETDDDYRDRLNRAWDLWPIAGTHQGILLELKAQGFPVGATGAHIIQHNGLYSYLAAGDVVTFGLTMECVNRQGLDGSVPGDLEGFTLDVRDQFYSKFIVLFPADVPALRPGTSTASLLSRTMKRWRPGKMLYLGAVVIETGQVWGWPLAMNWGNPGLKWGGNTIHQVPVE